MRDVSSETAVRIGQLSQKPGSSATLTGQTGGNGAFAAQADPLSTYLVSQAGADQVTSPSDPRLIKIGRLVIDTARNGRITFVVPRVDPGSYVVMVNARPAPGSAPGEPCF